MDHLPLALSSSPYHHSILSPSTFQVLSLLVARIITLFKSGQYDMETV